MRLRATESQAGLTPHRRRKNVRGAFVVPDPRAITAKNVLVIDDILTTGATARSVAQVLQRAGAANVWAATLSRARRAYDYPAISDRVYSEREIQSEARHGSAAEHPAAGQKPISVLVTPDQPSF
jgi:adenine/guanine phosphoribosyltransferase-like PRPP-binding protein